MNRPVERRVLLQTFAVLNPLLGGLAGLFKPAPANAQTTRQRLRPSHPSWPDAADWTKLADDTGGNLFEPDSLFGACETRPTGRTCQDALDNIGNPYWIGDQPSGTEVSGWLDAWTPAPSAYAVRARSAADVATAVRFASDKRLRLVVKGGGHGYLGTSNAPDSLLIWTRMMNAVTLHDAFVARGCEGQIDPVPAVTAESGALWMDLYNVVTTGAGRYVQGGGCTTVGVGGLVQSGGFGSFSKGFGPAAAGLLEAEVVTADGQLRVVNPCNDPELFWALKGGGGGTFGVVTRLTLRTYDLPRFFGFASGTIRARSEEAFGRLIAGFIAFYRDELFNPHWGEQVRITRDNTLEIAMVSQGLDATESRAVWSSFVDWVTQAGEDLVVAVPFRVGAGNARDWWHVAENPAMIRDTREGAAPDRGWWEGDQGQVGAFIHGYESLWLPASLLDPSEQPKLAEALFRASRHQRVELHFNKGLAGAPAETLAAARETAMNPAALDAFALAIIADGESPAYPGLARAAVDLDAARANARAIVAAAAELYQLAPDAGSYVSESSYFNESWQRSYWGEHYPRLLVAKMSYDPDGLFIVHHGVGSEDWSPDGFTRLR